MNKGVQSASATPKRRGRTTVRKTFFLRGALVGAMLGSVVTAAAFLWPSWNFSFDSPIRELVAETDSGLTEIIYTFKSRLVDSTIEPNSNAYSVPTVSEDELFWIRVGSFKEKNLANSFRGSLLLLNLPVETSSSVLDDQVWHLVSVGPYSKEVEARRVITQLRGENFQPRLVRIAQ